MTKHIKHGLIVAALMLGCANFAQADSWRFPQKLETQDFMFGSTRIVLTTDGRRDRQFPDFSMDVYQAGKRVATLPGVHFEQIFASSDNKWFVGLSNHGLPGSAAIVFTDAGRIVLLAHHGMAEFDYCSKSVTLQRVWFDADNPAVRFQLDGQKAKPGIHLRSCHGQEIDLIQTVRAAHARAAHSQQ